MTQHIGIVASSAEGAALCYRTICLEASALMGEHNHPEITMNSLPLAEHMRHIRANNWKALGESLSASARKVAKAGAEFAICPDNTLHQILCSQNTQTLVALPVGFFSNWLRDM